MNIPWTGSTNFEESTSYKDEVQEVDEEDPQQAKPARGLKAPAEPTQQERAKHELTHLPFRSWCPTCVANKRRADNYPKQTSKMPVVQFDFCYFKTAGEPTTTGTLAGIDVERGMVMATRVGDKRQDFQYHVNCIQPFLKECGRAQAVVTSTIIQSEQEDHLIALLKTAASKMGGNISFRQSPEYSSQAQGSVERFHLTLMGQNRTFRAQLQQNYDRTITSNRPIVPWLVRHTAYLLNRYATHADGNTAEGTKITDHHSVSLVKQYNSYYQQSNNLQRWNSASSKPSGLEETQRQEKLYWALATKSLESRWPTLLQKGCSSLN